MQVDDTVLCQKCNSFILTKCQAIHDRACNPGLKPVVIKPKPQKKGFFARLFSSSKQEQEKPTYESVQDMIPCTQCGESFPFGVFAYHQEECVGHQLTRCHQCEILFPTFLFDQHLQVCVGKGPKMNKNALLRNEGNHAWKNKENKQNEETREYLQIMHEDEEEDEVLNQMIAEMAKTEIKNSKLTQEPLTKNQLKQLTEIKLTSQEQCSICCCVMKKRAKHIILNCKHIYHKNCVTSWLGKNPFCPMCRQHALKI